MLCYINNFIQYDAKVHHKRLLFYLKIVFNVLYFAQKVLCFGVLDKVLHTKITQYEFD